MRYDFGQWVLRRRVTALAAGFGAALVFLAPAAWAADQAINYGETLIEKIGNKGRHGQHYRKHHHHHHHHYYGHRPYRPYYGRPYWPDYYGAYSYPYRSPYWVAPPSVSIGLSF